MSDLELFLDRAETLLQRVEQMLPSQTSAPDWDASVAFRWRKRGGQGFLQPVAHPHQIHLADLQGVDEQKKQIDRNTRQFVQGLPANNVLLTGARGTGKSSLIKAVMNQHAAKGLRLIEVERMELVDLPDIVELLCLRPERFIVFCDDLSFDAGEPGYRALKVALDGSVTAPSENVLIYATSNRRHLMPEFMAENLETTYVGEEIRPGETTEEKVSLSERFGLWLSFYPFDQEEYLNIVRYWLAQLNVSEVDSEEVRREALQWALGRGSRSGRSAWQFARDWAGRMGLRVKR
ncbi:MAG: ATP-binding protein [Gammaproteobacteria bacterium]|jgi:predicted AAA+ superfamily ATPase|nr:ATP-binding protein [Gammaproteobacteria bacterium]MBU1732604.1 ATP-binding protein [Gammaproteobacteria bacterium]MBU1893467.1 ATP-binding protein [Gammaproteobacteria bacterium]